MEDAFLAFAESARLMLLDSQMQQKEDEETLAPAGPSWTWVCSRILECLKAYSSGVTPAILLSDLLKAWLEKSKVERSWKRKENGTFSSPGLAMYKKQKQLRAPLSKVVTIDSVYEKKFISTDAVLEVIILGIQVLPGTSSYLLTLGDAWSSNSIDHYLHHRFYDLVDGNNGILKKSRELRLTGCRIRTAVIAGSSQTRLLPTEYLVALLDEEQDEDALLLGARFCSDTFSDIQLCHLEASVELCFYARLEKISEVEVHAQWNHVKQQKLILSDENKTCIPLVLWDAQLSLAGLFTLGSMIALERPFISLIVPGGRSSRSDFTLEYGSATHLFTAPFVPNEEQVILESTSQTLLKNGLNDNSILSQLMLPTDSQGSVDYFSFPYQLTISDIRPKMFNISLYGVVKSFEKNKDEGGSSLSSLWKMNLQDRSGSILIQLCCSKGWRAERLSRGQTLFISGLTSQIGVTDQLQCLWNEKDEMAQLVNLTQLPALLSSPCLYRLLHLHELSVDYLGLQVCRVQVKNLMLCESRAIHSSCGHFLMESVCKTLTCMVCGCITEEEIAPSVSMLLELCDRHGGECVASCCGQSANDILQAAAEDFVSWPQDEQALYLYSLGREEYMVVIYAGADSIQATTSSGIPSTPWSIGQALKCQS